MDKFLCFYCNGAGYFSFSIPGAYAVASLSSEELSIQQINFTDLHGSNDRTCPSNIHFVFPYWPSKHNSWTCANLPVTTIPVALYMLQGYFRGLPYEIEEAGLMDGLSRLAVIWKITLPLALQPLHQ